MDLLRYDFGYEWPWTWGHALAALVLTVLAATLYRSGRRRAGAACGALAAWAAAGAVIVNLVLRFSLPTVLPTEAFLASGGGRVVDLGAGSGRATVMVLNERPRATVTAVDIFSQEYGIGGNSQSRLVANAAAAGAAARLDVQTADIRTLPLPSGSYDGAVSVAVIDHLNRDGVTQALAEAHRVLKPGGDFLLVVINPDVWVRVSFPMLAEHGYFGQKPRPAYWREQLTAAGFAVVETGTQPGMLYLLARRPSPAQAAR